MARAEANSLFAEGRAREKRGAPERRPEVSRARWVMFPAILTSNRCFSPHSRILGSALRPRTAEERPQADCVSQSAEDDTAKLGGLRGLEPDLMTGRTIELASRGMKLALAGMLAAAVGGCVSSARDAYYSTRSEELAGSGSDGKVVAVKGDADELRQLILSAHRVQLATSEK